MRSTFLQILLIFSSLEGYRLQFSIPRVYLVYTVWHCTGQHCSSTYACTYRLLADTWRRLVSVITTLYYVAIIFNRPVWYRALSLRYACIRSSDIILIPQATFLPNFVSSRPPLLS